MLNFPRVRQVINKVVTIGLFTFVLIVSTFTYAEEKNSVLEQHELAQQAFNYDKNETAYIHLKNALQQDGNYIPSKVLMGKLLLRYGYINDAVLEFEEVINLGADIALFIQPFGEALLLSNKPQAVLNLAKDVRLSSQSLTQLYVFRGKAQAQLKNNDRELAEYKKALRLNPNSSIALNSIAGYYFKLQQLEKAQQFLDKSFQNSKQEYLTWHLQAQIYKQQSLNQQAIDTYLKALAIAPEFLDAKRGIASVYINQNDDEKALELVKQVLEKSPNDPRAKLLHANLLFKQNNNKEAKAILTSLNQKIALIPEDVQLKNNYLFFINALSQYLLENYQSALRNINKFLRDEPDNFQAISLAVNIYLKLGQYIPARDLLDKHVVKVMPEIDMAVTLCQLYIDNRNIFKCEELLPKLKALYPQASQLILVEAKLLESRRQASIAVTFLEQANDNNRNIAYEKALIRLYMRTEKVTKAGRLIEKLLKEYPQNIELMNALAASLIKLKKYPQALGVLKHILLKQPTNYSARFNTASALLEAGAAEQAKAMLLNLLDQRAGQANARLLLTKAQLALGNSPQAIIELQTLISYHPDHVNGNEMLMLLLKTTGQFEQALIVVNKLSKFDSLNENYLKEKAELYLLIGDSKQYQTQVNRLQSLWFQQADKLTYLATMQRNYGDIKGARTTINLANKLKPNNAQVNYENVKISLFEKDLKTANKYLSRLKKSTLEKSKILLLEGDYLLATQQAKPAQDKYLAAFELNNTNNMALAKAYNLALLGLNDERFEALLVAAIQQQNSNIYHRNILADFYLKNKRYVEAAEHYLLLEKAKRLPNRASILNNLAFSLMATDNLKAQIYAEQAVKLQPSSAAIVDTYGWILFKNKQFEQALKTLNQAKSIDSTNTEIRYHLAETLMQLSRKAEAKVELTYVLTKSRSKAELALAKNLFSQL
ncbi:MAG: PEP-CTERM system TPR-repeat protein PrsT [Colwellia sp.]|nr:PEP-CTERM system TPR-repeat protein PrsT [Colwellia sp.]